MNRLLMMLEDDRDRLDRFAAVLRSWQPDLEFKHWRSAREFISAFRVLTRAPCLIALDHDLFVEKPGDPDPGDGRDVSAFLTTQEPVCPILIHSSNANSADGMLFELLDAGWNARRISPLGQDWIEAYWFPVLMEMLG